MQSINDITINTQFTIYENAYSNIGKGYTLNAMIEDIKSDKFKEKTETIRNLYAKNPKDDNVKSIEFILADFDDFDLYLETRQTLEKDPYVFTLFDSPKKRLKALVKIPPTTDKENYKDRLKALTKYFYEKYKLKIDKGNISRTCFLSYDPKIYVNQNAKTFESIEPPKTKKTTSKPKYGASNVVRVLTKSLNTIFSKATKGNRHFCRLAGGRLVGGYIAGNHIDEITAFEILKNISDNVSDHNETSKEEIKTLQDAIEYGTKEPIELDVKKVPYSNKFEFIDLETGEIHSEESQFCFWTTTTLKNGNMKFLFNGVKLWEFLKMNGYKIQKISSKEKPIIRLKNNIIYESSIDEMIRTVIDYLNDFPFLKEKFFNESDKLIKSSKISFLGEPVKIEKYHDPKNKNRFFFKNLFVEVSKESIEFKDYSELNFQITENRIIDFDFDKERKAEISDFETFIRNVTRENRESEPEKRIVEHLLYTIGYSLHYEKTSDVKRISIFSENTLETNAGRSGKGLILKAISKMKPDLFLLIGGKSFDRNDKFAFQNVKPDTEILVIDDVNNDFRLDFLYNAVSDGFKIEQKNRQSILINIEDVPKILITTNFEITNFDESTNARINEVELTKYYNIHHKPIDDFGKKFFDDWNKAEWNDFYSFMFKSVQFYFQHRPRIEEKFSKGIHLSETQRLKKKYNAVGGKDVYEYCQYLEKGKRYKTQDINEKVKSTFNITRNFIRKLRKFCEIEGLDIEIKTYDFGYGDKAHGFVITDKSVF